MSKTIEGIKAIADELAKFWGRSVSVSAVNRYLAYHDPLPVKRVFMRVVADRDALHEWAKRQVQAQ